MMDSVEKYFLIEALREHGNNKTNAAKALGITREGCCTLEHRTG
jgi:transcriptional regulator with PAS, ATPase and Fis domain